MSDHHLIAFMLAAAAAGTATSHGASFPEARAAKIAPPKQTSNQGGVTITVAPPNFKGETLDFGVTLESHTQSLDDNLVQSSTLFSDGKSSAPLSWEGAPPGGHHRKGILRFKSVAPPPQAVELQIRRPGEAAPRIFRWRLK